MKREDRVRGDRIRLTVGSTVAHIQELEICVTNDVVYNEGVGHAVHGIHQPVHRDHGFGSRLKPC